MGALCVGHPESQASGPQALPNAAQGPDQVGMHPSALAVPPARPAEDAGPRRPPGPAGRGRRPLPSPLAQPAEDAGLAPSPPATSSSAEFIHSFIC